MFNEIKGMGFISKCSTICNHIALMTKSGIYAIYFRHNIEKL